MRFVFVIRAKAMEDILDKTTSLVLHFGYKATK